MNRLFIANKADVQAMLSRLSLCKKDKWEPVYLDPNTKIKWVGYRLDDNPGGLTPTHLRRLNMQLDEICKVAASTHHDDESAAAGHYIRWRITSDSAFECLIQTLEDQFKFNPTIRTCKNIQLAIAWSKLDKAFNFRTTLGKSAREITNDYNYYKAIASRASALKQKSIGVLGNEISIDPKIFN
jgi:hypothetical protein